MGTRLYRSAKDKVIAGVCGGLGEYLRVDPVVFRVLFVLAGINGVGLAVYIILWLLIPMAQVEYPNQQQMMRQNVEEMGKRARELGHDIRGAVSGTSAPSQQPDKRTLVVGGVLVAVGVLYLLDNLGLLWWVRLASLWPLLLIALGSIILLNNLKDKR
jgi:phage shock protein C